MKIFKLFVIGGRRWRLLHIPDLNQIFGNLHCIQCGTFLDLVAYEPKRHAVFVSQVLTDTAYVDIVFSGQEERHGVSLCGRVVHQLHAFAVGDGFTHFLYRERTFRFQPDGFRMRAQGRYANAHGRTLHVAVHDLLCLVEHLHFLSWYIRYPGIRRFGG